ncbi:hypothetical protein [Bacillus sp. FJAT-49736]|uniref:hypothetical protein n=1 Tax=Bacillus sp. FJAT-49736 TaxID=2833582 RepID=UPI001BC9E350|nr:hypothetical protein [Bacillus sp. FJAT-49736]MBS4173238.1 hypothetical protein [Bacillus sp. FJAT-49736]
MIKKKDVLQMLDTIEQQLMELEKEMNKRLEMERDKLAKEAELDFQRLRRKISTLENKTKNNISFDLVQSYA